MNIKFIWIVLVVICKLQLNIVISSNQVMKLSNGDDEQTTNIGLNKFDNCLVTSKCDENKYCQPIIEYCRVIYCQEKRKSFEQDYQVQNSHANCIEFCIHSLYMNSFGDYLLSYLECLYSQNDIDTFFNNSGYKSKYNYFGSYKPKIQIGETAIGVSSFFEEFFIKRDFEVSRILDHINIDDLNQEQNYLLKWSIEDENSIESEHCNFVKNPINSQKIHRKQLYQIKHPIQFVSLLTRKDCLKKILKEFDQALRQANKEQDQDEKPAQKNNLVLLFYSSTFILKGYYIDTRKNSQTKTDDTHKIIDGDLNQDVKYVLKPTQSSYGAGLKFARNFEEFRQNFIRVNQKQQNLIYKEYILEEFLENQLIINNKNLDLSFYVLVLSTNPLLIYAKKGYVRLNGQDYDIDSTTQNQSNPIFNSRYFEVIKSQETKGMNVENIFQTFDEFYETLIKQYNSTEIKNEKLVQKCLAIITYTIYAYASQIDSIEEDPSIFTKFSEFSILRFDFLLDKELNPFLIEVDENPLSGDHLQFNKARVELSNLLKDTIDYVDKLNKFSIGDKEIEGVLQKRKQFIKKNSFDEKNPKYQQLINDVTDFNYLTDVFQI